MELLSTSVNPSFGEYLFNITYHSEARLNLTR